MCMQVEDCENRIRVAILPIRLDCRANLMLRYDKLRKLLSIDDLRICLKQLGNESLGCLVVDIWV